MLYELLEDRRVLDGATLNERGVLPSQQFPVSLQPASVAVGDLSGDGVADLVTANSSPFCDLGVTALVSVASDCSDESLDPFEMPSLKVALPTDFASGPQEQGDVWKPVFDVPRTSAIKALVTMQAEGEAATQGTDGVDLVAFAKSLTASGVKVFGAPWAPACTEQRLLFQDGAKYLNFRDADSGLCQ